MTVQDDVDALFATAADAFGAVDVVINNAGLGGTANLVDMTDAQWAKVTTEDLLRGLLLAVSAYWKFILRVAPTILGGARKVLKLPPCRTELNTKV